MGAGDMSNAVNGVSTSEIQEVIERLAEFDPASLFEAAGQKGMLDPRIRPAWRSARLCGPAVTVECPPGDNLMLHVAVAHAPRGAVLVANSGSYQLAGAWGEILTAAAQARGIAGLVIDGAVRDIEAIEAAGFPVFSRGRAIGSCTKERVGRYNVPVQVGGARVCPGDVILGDGDGLVVVERQQLLEVYRAALVRRDRERELIVQLKGGRTTLELLGLTDPLPRLEAAPERAEDDV